MKNLILGIAALLCFISLHGQGEIVGNIYILNSKYDTGKRIPAIGIKVNAASSNGDYSKSKGEYSLKFSLKPGKTVSVSIGENDVINDRNGKEYELVNEDALGLVTIPEVPEDKPLNIIVCPKGYRDIVAQKYYKIIKTSSAIALAKKEKEYQALLNSQQKDYQKINELTSELASIQKQTDSILIYQEAFRLASINKDKANTRLLDYFKCIENGTYIGTCKEILSIDKANKQALGGITDFNEAIQELKTKAIASKAVFDYNEAAICYDNLISLSEKIDQNPLLLADYYELGGIVLDLDGQYKKSIKYKEKTVSIREKILSAKDPNLATAYNNLAISYQESFKFQEALKFHKKAIEIMDQQKASDIIAWTSLASSLDNQGVTYYHLKDYDNALENHLLALTIRKKADSTHAILGTSYNNIGLSYLGKKDYASAMTYLKKGMRLLEKEYHSIHPKLGIIYANIGACHQNLNQYEEAKNYLTRAISIQEKTLNPNHPDLANSYNSLALTYGENKEPEKALEYQTKSLKILEKNLPPNHPNLATSYSNIALAYNDLDQYELSIDYLKKAVQIQEFNSKNSHNDPAVLSFYYSKTALVYYQLSDYNKALEFADKSINTLNTIFPKNHPSFTEPKGLQIVTLREKGLEELKQRDFKLGLETFQRLVELYPDQLSWNYLGVCNYFQGNYDKALIAYDEAKKLGLDDATYWSNVGNLYLKSKDYQSAIKTFNKLVKVESNAKAWNYRGLSYYYSGKYLIAIQSYKKAKELGLDSTSYLNNLGTAYLKDKQFEKAQNAFKELEKLIPNEGLVFRNWAMYSAMQNKYDDALAYLQKAIDSGYLNLDWFETDDTMNAIRNTPEYQVLIKKLKNLKK